MTAWCVMWEDSKGEVNTVCYCNKRSVLSHVEYCLDNGMHIRNIYTVWGEGHWHRCIFIKATKTFKLKREWVIQCLKEYGNLTASEIAEKVNQDHDILITTQTVRSMLYQLDYIEIERVPDTKPIKWRLKE